jgi:hypothetical protein
MSMIAAAATARKRYPQPISDCKAFEDYIKDIGFTIFSGQPKPPNLQSGNILFNLGGRPFEKILYKDFRCFLIHEGKLTDAGLTEFKIEEGKAIETLVVGPKNQLPESWVLNLLKAIRWSPENAEEFTEER